ncbi:TonB-dependent receptor [Maribacter sp. 2307UL18-2]|uniref:TonB-dependent receptor n=1 Tax=Maribacter sp. 2307UL18-2 TaxID=3386274 RepID=UPI0039BD5875
MKKMYIAMVVSLMSAIAFSQGTITGTVLDGELNEPLPGASVVVEGTKTGASTDFDGNFTLEVSEDSGTLVFSYIGFVTKKVSFTSMGSIGEIVLQPDAEELEGVVVIGSGLIDLAEKRNTPVAVSTITKSVIQEKAVGNVEVPEIIKSTPSAFVSGQTGFGDSQLFLRGFDQINIATLLNGQPVNGMEDGRVYWSNWAGIADIANGVQVQRGLGSSRLAISSVGGTINLVMKSAEREKGGFVRMMGANDSYFKTTASYDSGINDKGWSFSVLLDHWQGHRKWAEGTFGSGQTYYFAAGYKPNDTHAFNVLLTGAPQQHGQRWSQSEEILEANPKFNQHWGFTEDGIESERTNYYHKPVFNFNWDYTISENSELATVAYASWGRGGGTGPRGFGRIRTADPDGDGPLFGQVDYAAIQAQNTAAGTGGSRDDVYIRRSSVNNHQWYGLVSNFNTQLNDRINFSFGTDLRFYTGDHFRQVADLYGLTGWTGDRPDGATVTETYNPTPWASLFNFADEGQRIDYDYSENINYQGIFSQIEYAADRFTVYAQGALSNQSYQRTGRFEGEGLGESEKLAKIGYNLKAGWSFDIAENHKIFSNVGYYSRQPFLDNIFVNIRESNDIFDNPEVDNEEITGIEVGYKYFSGGFKANFNFYITDWDNRVITGTDVDENGTPDDDSDDIFLNIFDRGVRQIHRGAELDLEYNIQGKLRVNGYLSAGSWQFDGTSDVAIYNDDTGQLVSENPGTNREGVKVTNAPQFTAGLSFRYQALEALSFDGNLNYFDRLWLNDGASVQVENVGYLDSYSLTDLGVTYNFALGENQLSLRGNVFNLFDEVRIQQSDRFGLFNTNGITYNVSLRYNF